VAAEQSTLLGHLGSSPDEIVAALRRGVITPSLLIAAAETIERLKDEAAAAFHAGQAAAGTWATRLHWPVNKERTNGA